MNVNFNGYEEKILTFQCDSAVTTTSQWVKISGNGTVGIATANSPLVGVTVNVRNGYAGVMVSGVVTAKKSGDIPLGYSNLVYTAQGIAVNSAGRKHLVLTTTDDTVTFIL